MTFLRFYLQEAEARSLTVLSIKGNVGLKRYIIKKRRQGTLLSHTGNTGLEKKHISSEETQARNHTFLFHANTDQHLYFHTEETQARIHTYISRNTGRIHTLTYRKHRLGNIK
jgi:hypothetical protein